MTWSRIGSAIFAASKGGAFLDEALLLMFVAVLATAMAVAIGVLLSFNLYLISTCQVHDPRFLQSQINMSKHILDFYLIDGSYLACWVPAKHPMRGPAPVSAYWRFSCLGGADGVRMHVSTDGSMQAALLW